jgi:hypothetical protein
VGGSHGLDQGGGGLSHPSSEGGLGKGVERGGEESRLASLYSWGG